MWKVKILTLFPEMFPGPFAFSLANKGLEKGAWELQAIQIRDFAFDKHKTVDDTCYGPNVGMLLKPDVINEALTQAYESFGGKPQVIYTSPRGSVFNQKMVKNFINKDGLIILCGRYEGVDERVIEQWRENFGLLEVSIGDYILSGGELAAAIIIDSCVRCLPDIVHNKESLSIESFELDLLEFPQYTKPYVWQGRVVPEILLSGDHKRIAAWQKEQSERITEERRPDLWERYKNKESREI